MKTNDPSFRSLELLNTHLSKYFDESVHLVDLPESKHQHIDTQHVILTGLFYQRIFEVDYFPDRDFYLYCLSPNVKKVLTDIFCFDNNTIQTIPRYKLIPSKDEFKELNLNTPFSVIFAGRLSPHKNIEFIIFFSFFLQLMHMPESKLLLFGNYDNEHHRDQLDFFHIDYEKKINKIIESLPWPGDKPKIHTRYKADEWIEKIPDNSLFFSASNVLSEDFSMSVAQLQSQNPIPMLLPTWGAFKDVRGPNVLFYNSDLIGSTYDSIPNISQKAKNLVTKFLLKDFIKLQQAEDDNQEYLLINRFYLREKLEENKLKWGTDLDNIVSGDFYKFSMSTSGQKILKLCRGIFNHF